MRAFAPSSSTCSPATGRSSTCCSSRERPTRNTNCSSTSPRWRVRSRAVVCRARCSTTCCTRGCPKRAPMDSSGRGRWCATWPWRQKTNCARPSPRATRLVVRCDGCSICAARGCRERTRSPLIGAFYFMDRAKYAALASAAADDIAGWPVLSGPRIIVKGSPLDHPHLHAAIEAHGAVVVAEDDWWGSRAVGRDIAEDGDPVEAIFDKYFLDAPSPRVFPPSAADEWFIETIGAAPAGTGVVFYLPPEDDILGWGLSTAPRRTRSPGDTASARA